MSLVRSALYFKLQKHEEGTITQIFVVVVIDVVVVAVVIGL
jgi:hypothetical protein